MTQPGDRSGRESKEVRPAIPSREKSYRAPELRKAARLAELAAADSKTSGVSDT